MLVNATVSHELRNPLNSLIAQNIQKAALYQELQEIINCEESRIQAETKDKITKILKDLKSGLNIQDSSANLMAYLVQDLLDYSQIKAGKFRKNLKPFNIKDAIEEVMCI